MSGVYVFVYRCGSQLMAGLATCPVEGSRWFSSLVAAERYRSGLLAGDQ